MHYKKKAQCGFEPAKMHWAFYRFTNAFQMIFDALSNFICYEGSFTIMNYLSDFSSNQYHELLCEILGTLYPKKQRFWLTEQGKRATNNKDERKNLLLSINISFKIMNK